MLADSTHRKREANPICPVTDSVAFPTSFKQLSWRDPDGFIVRDDGRILRAVASEKADRTRELLAAPWMRRLIEAGSIPATRELTQPPPLAPDPGRWVWFEHDPLPFPCYPHEATALQLYDAGQLSLTIAIEAVQNDWALKDASAWNVLHSRSRPVFVDLLSFDRLQPNGTWMAYGQFVRHFLLPLLLYRHLRIPPAELFLVHRDGITPERAREMLPGMSLASWTGLELVVLPTLLSGAGGRSITAQGPGRERRFDAELGKSLVLRTLRRLQRRLARLNPDRSKSKSLWAEYEQDRDHYTAADLAAKREFVRSNLGLGNSVLDVGCNAGEFSLLAAQAGKTVVATDFDHAALQRLYARVRGSPGPVSPVLLDIGRPTPAIGWNNDEVASFIERAAGRFDCIMLLGLLHHLLVSERATLPMLVDLLDRLNPRRVIVEWVDPKDRRFRQLAGLNAGLYSGLDAERMESEFARKFRLSSKSCLPDAARVLYSWHR